MKFWILFIAWFITFMNLVYFFYIHRSYKKTCEADLKNYNILREKYDELYLKLYKELGVKGDSKNVGIMSPSNPDFINSRYDKSSSN